MKGGTYRINRTIVGHMSVIVSLMIPIEKKLIWCLIELIEAHTRHLHDLGGNSPVVSHFGGRGGLLVWKPLMDMNLRKGSSV